MNQISLFRHRPKTGRVTRAYCDVDDPVHNGSGRGISLVYHPAPYSAVGLAVSAGLLSAGDSMINSQKRFFINAYRSVVLGLSLELGQFKCFQTKRLLKPMQTIYVSAGGGLILNRMKTVRRTGYRENGTGYVFPGLDRSRALTFPIRTGATVYLKNFRGYRRAGVFVDYQFNITTGEGLDGYNDPPSRFQNRHADMYSVLSAGIRYHFGKLGLYW